MSAMHSVKVLAVFVLIVGGSAMGLLTFGVSLSLLFYLFTPPPVWHQVVGYASLLGPIPLVTGSVFTFFERTRRIGAKVALAGSALMTAYMVVCFLRLDIRSVGMLEKLLWFALTPLAVLTVDAATFKIYKLTKLASLPARQAVRGVPQRF
jgi:hypothetical protein